MQTRRKTIAAGVGAAALAATLGATTGTASAAPPELRMYPATTAATLPAGCVANDVKVTAATDGSYHGYVQATCSKKAKLFYVSRDSKGKWALRSTKIDMPIVYATTIDSTGTYFVGKRSNHDLVLVRRNGNGSLSKVHVLAKVDPIGFAHVERASVAASNGNYWAVWDENTYSTDFAGHDVYQASSISPAIKPSVATTNLWYAPTIVRGAGNSFRLLACELSSEQTQDDPVSSTVVATRNAGKWRKSQQFTGDTCSDTGTASPGVAGYLHGHVYFSRTHTGGVYDNQSSAFRRTALTGFGNPIAVLPGSSTQASIVSKSSSGQEVVWNQTWDGSSFPADPIGALAAAPVPVYKDQIIARSGAIIRVFIQKTGTGKPGRRLLEQLQDTRL